MTLLYLGSESKLSLLSAFAKFPLIGALYFLRG